MQRCGVAPHEGQPDDRPHAQRARQRQLWQGEPHRVEPGMCTTGIQDGRLALNQIPLDIVSLHACLVAYCLVGRLS
jgi:hypothetical protein